jgi:hypothetical protein
LDKQLPNDQSAEELIALLKAMDRKLSALLSISVDQTLRSSQGLAKPRPRSIDRLLSDAGLLGTEIARILGKTPQAVSQILASDNRGRSRKKPATQTTSPADSDESSD